MTLLEDYYTVQKTKMFDGKVYALLAVYSLKREAEKRASTGKILSIRNNGPTKNLFRVTKTRRGHSVWWRQELKKKGGK